MIARRRRLHIVVAGAAAGLPLVWAAPAAAAPAITVSPDKGVDPNGQVVTVKGSGFDTEKGIYVAWCVRPAPGQKPSPCGGGDDRSGTSGNSVWISSSPPAYGLGLAQPYGDGGTFAVQIRVTRIIGSGDTAVDCFKTACAVATRNDHERTDDRSQDTFAPVVFTGEGAAPAPRVTAAPTTTRATTATTKPGTKGTTATTRAAAGSSTPRSTTPGEVPTTLPTDTAAASVTPDVVSDTTVPAATTSDLASSTPAGATAVVVRDDGGGGIPVAVPVVAGGSIVAAAAGGFVVVRRRRTVPA